MAGAGTSQVKADMEWHRGFSGWLCLAGGVPVYMGNGGDFAAIEDLIDIIVV